MVLPLVSVSNIGAMRASKDDSWTADLMLKDICIATYLFAATFTIATLELDLGKEIPRYSIYLVELAITSAIWTVIGIFSKPVTLALRAYRFLTYLAFEGVLENVVTNTADKFRKEGGHIRLIIYIVFFIDVCGHSGIH